MLKRFCIKNKKNSGFTIIELMIVIVIIAILAGIVFISYRGITNKAKEVSLTSDMSNAKKALAMHYAEYGRYPDTIDCDDDLDESNICVDFGEDNEIDYDPDYDFDDDFDELYDDDEGYRLIGRIKPFNPSVKTYIATDKTEAKEFSGWLQISAGFNHTCGVYHNGKAYCWGDGGNGRLGNGASDDKDTPYPVSTGQIGEQAIRLVTAGSDYTCAIAANRQAYCWGSAEDGRLGNDKTTGFYPTPVAVERGDMPESRTIKAISAGVSHTCAIAVDNKAYCWGGGSKGQLGNDKSGAFYVEKKPVRVLDGDIGVQGIVSITSGSQHTCAVADDSIVYCWGTGNYRIGRISNIAKTPAKVIGPDNGSIGDISADNDHTCAVASNSQAYCWGNGAWGVLGNNEINGNFIAPVAVNRGDMPQNNSVRAIATGNQHTCAIGIDNQSYCWGYGEDGAIGNNLAVSEGYPVPVAVVRGDMPEAKTVKRIDAGGYHTCVIAGDNQAYCWGYNRYGQLGNDSTVSASEPKLVINP